MSDRKRALDALCQECPHREKYAPCDGCTAVDHLEEVEEAICAERKRVLGICKERLKEISREYRKEEDTEECYDEIATALCLAAQEIGRLAEQERGK